MGAHIQHNTLLNSSEEWCGLCLHPAPMCQLYLQKVHVADDYRLRQAS
jgi:hypothetical protein